VHLEQGQAAEALKFYDDVFPKAMALVPKGDIVAELHRRRAECHLLLGRFVEAHEEAQLGLSHCRELGDRYEEAATYRVAALAAAALERPDEAKGLFHQGFTLYDDIETPYEWGKLWMSYGDWLTSSQAGPHVDQRGALEAYHAARDHFERMGAKAKLADANARIARQTAAISPGVSAPIVAEGGEAISEFSADAPHRPPRRRPSRASETERRSQWALEGFGTVTANTGVFHQLEMAEQLARSKAPVLILGESGTGKELIALALHRFSRRSGQFMAINCAALPRDVIQSELFGHVAGSFTGASRDKAGLFEVCDHGTALLDEIGEMPTELQSHLLRFLETGETRRVGATRNAVVDTRVVASTNRDRALLKRGDRFRTDLYYRLAHGVIELPPLRRRGARDIELLAEHFLAQACREEHKQVALSDAALERLVSYPWPGNIRELKAELLRRVVLATSGHVISADEFHLDSGLTPTTLEEELEHTERERIRQVIGQFPNKADAARALGIPRTTLINKMKRLGLEA
jgi:DNA-binding NtrC family response regulator